MAAANKSWGGRFASAQADSTRIFTESQSFDRALYAWDIAGSKARARMLARQGIITEADARSIVDGLDKIKAEIESGQFGWREELEDVHMNIESRLAELIGDAGKKLHTGRSRNDQVALDFHLFVSDGCESWRGGCLALCARLCGIAERHQGAIMPGFTHLQPAQPVALAQHLLAYANMFKRDAERLADCLKRARVSPLGAAALAGSTYPLDPLSEARELGFERVYANSMDAVSDRDFALEALFCASVIAMHLSRLCEELILWATPAFGFVKLPDAFATGSSIMPQKKNPDVAELMRGKTGRIYGNLVALLTIMKGLPLAYNRDLQEDKEPFLDTDRTMRASLPIMAEMLGALEFDVDRMRGACASGYLNATELADYLVAKGMPFRDAHHVAGRAVALAERQGRRLEELTLEDLRGLSSMIDADVYGALDYDACVARRETPGGTGPRSIKRQIDDLKRWLADACQGGA